MEPVVEMSQGRRVSGRNRVYLASKTDYRDYLASKIHYQNFTCKWKSRNSIYQIEFKPLDSRKNCSKSFLVPNIITLTRGRDSIIIAEARWEAIYLYIVCELFILNISPTLKKKGLRRDYIRQWHKNNIDKVCYSCTTILIRINHLFRPRISGAPISRDSYGVG